VLPRNEDAKVNGATGAAIKTNTCKKIYRH